MSPEQLAARRERAKRCTRLIRAIANNGRRFFHHAGRVACIEVDHRGAVWWHDEDTGARIYTHRPDVARWKGFTHGGTMRGLATAMRDYITGKRWQVGSSRLGPWPAWLSDGDPWGYGPEAMAVVRRAAWELGLVDGEHYPEVSDEERARAAEHRAKLGATVCCPPGVAS